MRPTKSKDLIAKTAKDLNLSEDLITDVINFYYDIVSKKIEKVLKCIKWQVQPLIFHSKSQCLHLVLYSGDCKKQNHAFLQLGWKKRGCLTFFKYVGVSDITFFF